MSLSLVPWSATYMGNSFPVYLSSCFARRMFLSRILGSPNSPRSMWRRYTSAPTLDIRYDATGESMPPEMSETSFMRSSVPDETVAGSAMHGR